MINVNFPKFDWLRELYKDLPIYSATRGEEVGSQGSIVNFANISGGMYQNFSSRVRLLSFQQFARYEDVLKFSRSLRSGSFFVKASRDKIRADYEGLATKAPFSQNTRFPDDLYVHLNNRDFERMIGNILHAIDLPDRMIEKGREVDYSMNDAKRHYDVSVDAFLQKVCALDEDELRDIGVYSREAFENVFGLNWVAAN